MKLEDVSSYEGLDRQDMIGHIIRMPGQLLEGWELGNLLPINPADGVRQIILAGMGGSAIGSELLAVFAGPICPLPVVVLREDSLPGWARGSETLVISTSHSGATEETLSVFEQARERGCRLMVIGAGGRLAGLGTQFGCPV